MDRNFTANLKSMIGVDWTCNPIAEKAFHFAVLAHQEQTRKYTNQPYLVHPARVAHMMARHGSGFTHVRFDEVIATALLHDVKEDCGYDVWVRARSSSWMTSRVSVGVDYLTKDKRVGETRQARNQRYNEKLVQAPDWVLQIKCADVLDNIVGLSELDPQFARTYLIEKALFAEHVKRVRPGIIHRRLFNDMEAVIRLEMQNLEGNLSADRERLDAQLEQALATELMRQERDDLSHIALL